MRPSTIFPISRQMHNPVRFSTGKRRRRHKSLGNHVTKLSGVSVELTTLNVKDIPADT